jgi:hypothetical protein
MTAEDHEQLDRILKKLHPEIKRNFYGRVTIEVDYKSSVMGKQPYTELRCEHLVQVKKM